MEEGICEEAEGTVKPAPCDPGLCSPAPDAVICHYPSSHSILTRNVESCNLVNNPQPNSDEPPTECSQMIIDDGAECQAALLTYACSTSCATCPDPLTYDPSSHPTLPVSSVCDQIATACPTGSSNNCFGGMTCDVNGLSAIAGDPSQLPNLASLQLVPVALIGLVTVVLFL